MLGLDSLFALLFLIVSALASPLYVGDKRANFQRDFMHFGKRAADLYELEDGEYGGRAFMPFGKRDIPLEEIYADKKNFNRDFMHFGKRAIPLADVYGREFMHFGKRR